MSVLFQRSLLVLPLLAQTLPMGSRIRKLNGPLAREPIQAFNFLQVSPSGGHLLYAADRDGNQLNELYSSSLRGEAVPVELAAVSVEQPSLTRDGKYVVFGSDLDADGTSDVALVPIDGSAGPRSLASGSGAVNVWFFEPSADLEHVVHLRSAIVGYQPNDIPILRSELYSVELKEGSAPRRLSGNLVPGGSVVNLALSKDGRTVLYQADQQTDGVYELFVAPVDGSEPPRRLELPLVPGGDVLQFAFDADASHALYTADQEVDERFELFSVPVDGSAPPQKLNGPLVAGGDIGGPGGTVQFSPDARRIVYRADVEVDQRFELFSVPADGSAAAVKLNAPLERVVSAMISYDSAWVVYLTDPSGTQALEIHGAPIDGSAPARVLGGPLVPGDYDFAPQISFDSRFVVYGADPDGDGLRELYRAPIDGSAEPVNLSGSFRPAHGLFPGFSVMREGALFLAQEPDGLATLSFAPFASGSTVRRLASGSIESAFPVTSSLANPPTDFGAVGFESEGILQVLPLLPGAQSVKLDALLREHVVGNVEKHDLAPAGERALYVAREEDDVSPALYSVSTGERRVATQLTANGAAIGDTLLSPDGRRAIFESAPNAVDPLWLNSAALDGVGTVVLLHRGDASGFAFPPGGRQLVFRAREAQRWHLFAVALDGSGPSTLLSAALPADSFVEEGITLSADGRWVAFRSSASQLFVASLEGAAPTALVSAAGQFVSSRHALAPDGSRVFFLTDPAGNRKGELFAAPGDGSAAPTRLSAEIGARDDVRTMALTPDGTRVLYLLDPQGTTGNELYSVRTDGSAPPERLDPALPVQGTVSDFQLAPNGAFVVYRANLGTTVRFELFSVPVDGSRTPARVGHSPLPQGNVLDYRIGPDSARVVYRAEAEAGAIDLFSAPARGSRGLRRIGQALRPGGSVISYEISADGRTVVFAAERDIHLGIALLATPIDGREKPIDLLGSLDGPSSALDYSVNADASLVTFRMVHGPGVIELFATHGSTRVAEK